MPPPKPSKILPRHEKDVPSTSTSSTTTTSTPKKIDKDNQPSILDFFPPLPIVDSTNITKIKSTEKKNLDSKWTERTSQWWAGASFDCSPSPSILPIPSQEMLQLAKIPSVQNTKNTISPKDLLAQFDKSIKVSSPTKHLKDILHIK